MFGWKHWASIGRVSALCKESHLSPLSYHCLHLHYTLTLTIVTIVLPLFAFTPYSYSYHCNHCHRHRCLYLHCHYLLSLSSLSYHCLHAISSKIRKKKKRRHIFQSCLFALFLDTCLPVAPEYISNISRQKSFFSQ